MSPTKSEVIEVLRPVEDPELHRSIVELDMVREIEIADGQVSVQIALTVPGCPLRGEITRRVEQAVTALSGVDSVALDFTVMTDDEREALRRKLHGDPSATAGSQPSHGHAEARPKRTGICGEIKQDERSRRRLSVATARSSA